MDPFLTTGRLRLRTLTESDVDDLVALHNDPEVMRYLTGGEPIGRDRIVTETLPAMTRRYPDWPPVHGHWAAEDHHGRFLGWFGLHPLREPEPGTTGPVQPGVLSLGYRLCRDAWGHGYATEGARALIDLGFAQPGVHRVIAETMAVNRRSRAVMTRAGLRFVRVFHRHWDNPLPGTEYGEVLYALNRDDR